MAELNLSAIDLNLLVVFDAVLRERHVSRAADQLNLTQSGVSRALSRFRALLGDPLFIRVSGGVQPTALAERLGPQVAAILEQVRDAISPRQPFDPASSREEVRIGLTDYIAMSLLPELIRITRAAAPGVRISTVQASSASSAALVERHEIDLFVGRVADDAPRGLCSAHLFQEQNVCVGRAGHPAFRSPLTKAAFAGLEHLHISPTGRTGYIDEALRRQGCVRSIRHTTAHFLLAPAILQDSDLITVAPLSVARLWAERDGLEIQTCPYDLGEHEIIQLWHLRADLEPLSRWMRGLVNQVLGSEVATCNP